MKLQEGRFIQGLRNMFSLRWDMADPDEIHNTIISGAKLQGTNMCILMLAILIASIGLNMNSTAVIIGAMLISPLMGGITAIGYGIATNDLNLSKGAAIRLGIQVVICLSPRLFTLLSHLSPQPPPSFSPEPHLQRGTFLLPFLADLPA